MPVNSKIRWFDQEFEQRIPKKIKKIKKLYQKNNDWN